MTGLTALFCFDFLFSSWSPLSISSLFFSIYNAVNLFDCSGCGVISPLMVCHPYHVESVVFISLKDGDQKPEAGSSAPEIWIIIEPLTLWNSDRQDLIQKDACLHWKQAPLKSSKLQCKTTHVNLPAKEEHTQKIKRPFSQFSHSVVSNSLQPLGPQHSRPLRSNTNSKGVLN